MNKEDLLKHIAEVGYNVGFGAKKHFATYDMLDKVPSIISFISIFVGIYSLIFDQLSIKEISATLSTFGVIGLCLSVYGHKKDRYQKIGVELTDLFNDLKSAYYEVKNTDNLNDLTKRVRSIEKNFNSSSISRQLIFSDWIAHYKFFWQHQIDWIDKELKFRLFKDKLPLSFTALIIAIFIMACVLFI